MYIVCGFAIEILKRRSFPEAATALGWEMYGSNVYSCVSQIHAWQPTTARGTGKLHLIFFFSASFQSSPSIAAQAGSLNVGARESDNAKCTFLPCSLLTEAKKKKKGYQRSPLTTMSEPDRFNGLSSEVIYDGRPLKPESGSLVSNQ